MSDHLHFHISHRAHEDEKHKEDVTAILFHNGKVYTGSDDGRVKIWTPNLILIAEISAHPCSVFSIAASEEHIYSCSDEGTIRSFDIKTLKELNTVVSDDTTEYWKLFYTDGHLYSGDNLGNLIVWKHGKEVGETNIAEPIKDLAVSGKYLFTVKDSDLVVTELHLDVIRVDAEKKKQIEFGVKTTHMGRHPLTLVGKKYVACADREGKDIVVIENNDKTNFKQFTKIEGAHEMIINALAGADYNGQTLIFSGGWDKKLRKFRFDEDVVKLDCTSEVGFVINSIAVGDNGKLYVGGEEGSLISVDIEWKG